MTEAHDIMQDDIFGLLMLILMLENGGGTENINQMVLMFLLLQNRSDNDRSYRRRGDCTCGREDGFTF